MENKNNKKTYWKDLKEATQTTAKGMGLTWEHFQKSIRSLAKTSDNPTNKSGNSNAPKNQSFDPTDNSNLGIVTNLYPHETMPIPDNGRYKLHNEIEDCIVCNKCVEVCPVNCIEIDSIRGTEQVGTASDGSPIRFYAAKFDIDMAKCFFCGLCTVVCPTECLTMTKEFDFSETDVSKMNYEFGNLNEQEINEKQKEWDDFQAEKASKKTIKKPILKPILKHEINENKETENEVKPIKKPSIKIKKIVSQPKSTEIEDTQNLGEKAKLKPIRIKLPIKKTETTENLSAKNEEIKKIRIKLPTKKTETTKSTENQQPPLVSKNEDTSSKSDTKKPIKIKIIKPNSSTEKETQKTVETKSEIKKPIIKIKLAKQKTENKVDKIDLENKASNLEEKPKQIDENDSEKD